MGHYDTCMADRCVVCGGADHHPCPFAPKPQAPAIKARRGGSKGRREMSCGMTDRRGQSTDEAEDRAIVEIQSEANKRQVGGEHYKSPLQHWDFITNHGYSYLIGCATKYLMRWRQKNGAQDVEKSLHFTQKALEKGGRALIVGHQPNMADLQKFLDANKLGELERTIVGELLLCYDSSGRVRLGHAITLLGILLEQAREWEQSEVRRSQLGLPRPPVAKSTVRGYDPAQDVVQQHLCDTIGGPDRPVKVGDTVIVKSHLPDINGRDASVVEVDGVWVNVVFARDGRAWTDQYKSLTIVEKTD